jgi:hypothetical protein
MEMALSPEKKATNKEESLLRREAYRARYKEREEALSRVDVKALEHAANMANLAFDVALKTRNNEADSIRRQIAELEEQLKTVNDRHANIIDPLNADRRNTLNVMHAERCRQQSEIESNYPDLDCYGVGTWNAPSGYIESFSSANAEELAKKKAKRERSKSAV